VPHRRIARPRRKPTPPIASNPGSPAAPAPADVLSPPQAAALPPPAPAPAAGDAHVAVGELIGLDQQAAKNLLGATYEVSEQSPAVVWRFHAGDCELDLAFYLDLRSGEMRTLSYEFKGEGPDMAKQEACLNAIVASKRGQEPS
jgi:hypothetical protein